MTYVEYMRRLGVSVEPEVKPKVVPTVEPLPLLGSFRYQATLDGYVEGLPRRVTSSLQRSRRAVVSLVDQPISADHTEYYRRVLLAIDLELAHRNSTPL
jgi:hypothetical protein